MNNSRIKLSTKRRWIKGVIRSAIINYLKIIVLTMAGYMKFVDAPPTVLFISLATILILIIFYLLIKYELNLYPARIAEIELSDNKISITTLDVANRPKSIYEYSLDEVNVFKKGTVIKVVANSNKFGLEDRFSFYSINEIVDFFKKNEIEVLDENKL